jgi:hypothetical protein
MFVFIQQDAQFVRELAEIALSKKKQKKQKSPVSESLDEGDLDSFFSKLEQQEEDALSSQEAASKGLFSSSKSQWKKGFLSAPTHANKKKAVKPQQAVKSSPKPIVNTTTSSLKQPGSSTTKSSDEKRVTAITEQNTLLNSTVSTSAQDRVVEKMNPSIPSSSKDEPSHDQQSSSTVPKKVSRFKQNRAASATAPTTSSSTVKPVPFTGQIFER